MQNSKRCLKESTQNCKIEALKLAATVNRNTKNQGVAVVPNRSDVLKQDYLQSFKTRRHNFAMDGKIMTLCLTLFIKLSWFI
ncbi:hypothetical protein DWQ65_00090 [Treponema phagedenis]|uniref:Uncharacterized protein n=1 Tax=Treponema phagedenis TaxID=162 RepID=A0A0B7GWU6_TREPH|nr:hypothetical protein FUT79_11215 [Treponema phagedenis]QEJ98816.1 hypothetical protein FUT82_12970 [Treponema phagedenis]QEK00518.1 hypothetical protein FUT84_04570 [Treponema phagedenis]QEK04321.1 hypothetical protein FUT83_11260 [Treponema phagedenis]QEK05523.1 hypothetical protein FUT80_01470 [Treponema phagedenis]